MPLPLTGQASKGEIEEHGNLDRVRIAAMLKRIRLKDFKSFVDEEVEVAPLTLLVGANASGKSNFLDAMRFLKGIAFDLSLGDVLNGETNPGRMRGLGYVDVPRRLHGMALRASPWTATGQCELAPIPPPQMLARRKLIVWMFNTR
jgi:hypothetical protein